uniref:Uncharacterized protein n=1 Tax=Globisporangium ultimum (strain ATCC 200006 / CBS 805.95 / DAOM BR144) TaxID=431595 RepID=K3WYF5_GLOUD
MYLQAGFTACFSISQIVAATKSSQVLSSTLRSLAQEALCVTLETGRQIHHTRFLSDAWS